MPWAKGARVAEMGLISQALLHVIDLLRSTIASFNHLSLSPFLQVGPACRNANVYPDPEQSLQDSTVETASCNWLTGVK